MNQCPSLKKKMFLSLRDERPVFDSKMLITNVILNYIIYIKTNDWWWQDECKWIAESHFPFFFFDISLNKWEYSSTFHPLTRTGSQSIFKWTRTCSLSTRWFTDAAIFRVQFRKLVQQENDNVWPDENEKRPSRKVSSLRTRLVHYFRNRRCVNVNKWPLCIWK